MQIFKTTTGLKGFLEDCRDNNKKISLVPTMGGLHDGHLKLVDRARAISDIVVVSIFVNPTQFARGEDFEDYPNTLSSDQKKLESKGVDVLFLPSKGEIYPDGLHNDYKVGEIGQILCGAFRPVTLMVLRKLFSVFLILLSLIIQFLVKRTINNF